MSAPFLSFLRKQESIKISKACDLMILTGSLVRPGMTILFLIILLLFPVTYTLYPTFAQDAENCDPATEECAIEEPADNTAKSSTDNQTTTTTPTKATVNESLVTGSEGEKVSNTNYKAPQHANYTIENLEHSLLCELTGMSPVSKCVGHKVENGKVGLYLFDKAPGGGAVGGLTTVIASLYNPPTSTAEYVADLGQNLGLAKPAYAQSVGGSGEGIIKPIYTLWQVVRNISYIAFTIVFVVVGFMIMFRQKISQQAVVSVQTALPGLVVGLILVTFSYLIASLIIDLSFLSIQVVAYLFIQVKDSSGAVMNIFNIPDEAASSNVFHLYLSSIRLPDNVTEFRNGFASLFSSVGMGVPGVNSGLGGAVLIPALIGAVIGTLLAPGAGTLIGLGAGAGSTAILGLIIPLILIIVIVIQFFRLLFQLVNCYIAILISTVLGPFVILFASLPGRSGSLGFWWRSILGNSLVFPAVFAGFLFAGLILGTPTSDWKATLPLFGGLNIELLRLIIAYGIILGIPAIPGMIKRAMKVPELAGIPQEATAGFLGGFGLGRTGATEGFTRYWRGENTKPGSASAGPVATGYARLRGRFPRIPLPNLGTS